MSEVVFWKSSIHQIHQNRAEISFNVYMLHLPVHRVNLGESFCDQKKVIQKRNLLATVRGYFHNGMCDKR